FMRQVAERSTPQPTPTPTERPRGPLFQRVESMPTTPSRGPTTVTITAADRAAINRRNAARRTRPRAPAGRSPSKLNALNHRTTAKTPVLPGEDPDAFRGRLEAWAEALGPEDVVEQFLVDQAATASWKIQRADRIEAERLAAAARAAAEERRAGRRAEAEHLGRLLL